MANLSFTLTSEQYTALVALARKGSRDLVSLEQFLQSIEKANGITRYALWVQWQESETPLPPHARFPDSWPPELRAHIEQLNRPVCLADVEKVLDEKASKPISVLVTPDPAARVGWTDLSTFFKVPA